MAMLADTADAVIGTGTHTGSHTACLPGPRGRQLAAITIRADLAGCRALMAWARRNAPGPRRRARHRGDGFFARFDGPARATRCALAIHQAVRDVGLQVRIGLHAG